MGDAIDGPGTMMVHLWNTSIGLISERMIKKVESGGATFGISCNDALEEACMLHICGKTATSEELHRGYRRPLSNLVALGQHR